MNGKNDSFQESQLFSFGRLGTLSARISSLRPHNRIIVVAGLK